MFEFLVVGAGGAIGAMARYMISLIPIHTPFPFLTLITNLIGAIIIGFIAGFINTNPLSHKSLLFWKMGICGGFTTFSAFSLEAMELIKDGKSILSLLYIILSVTLCLIGVLLGEFLSKQLLQKT